MSGRYRNGSRSGYAEYRYGSPHTKRKHARIFDRKRREALVSQVMDVLRHWQRSPFEHEGSMLAGMRSALCLAGYGWARADKEVEIIVATALHLLGAERPSYEEAQREYAVPRENCLNCAGELDDERIARADRFCCVECAKGFANRFDSKWERRQHAALNAANRAIEIATRPTVQCEECGRGFKPRGNDRSLERRYCTPKCAGVAKTTMPEKACSNADCGKLFRVQTTTRIETQRYCCAACYAADNRTRAKDLSKDCQFCGMTYSTSDPNSIYCSSKHAVRAYQFRSGRVIPKTLSPAIFDYMQIRAGVRITDALFAEVA